MSEWKPEHFSTLEYTVDGDVLDAKTTKLRLVLQVNGKTEVDLTSQFHEFEPGIVAFVSKPGERAIRVVKVIPARAGAVIDGQGDPIPAPAWAQQLLDL